MDIAPSARAAAAPKFVYEVPVHQLVDGSIIPCTQQHLNRLERHSQILDKLMKMLRGFEEELKDIK